MNRTEYNCEQDILTRNEIKEIERLDESTTENESISSKERSQADKEGRNIEIEQTSDASTRRGRHHNIRYIKDSESNKRMHYSIYSRLTRSSPD